MPLYEYRCNQCGYRFEKIQSFSAEPLTECPKCQGELVRPMTAPNFQFKGSGWYVNDYAGKSTAPSTDSSSDSAAASTSSDSSSSSESSPSAASAPAAPSTPSSTTTGS